MKNSAEVISLSLNTDRISILTSIFWALAALIATYMTTTSFEMYAAKTWCTLLSTNMQTNSIFMIGHCPWCYAAAASMFMSITSLIKRT